MLFFRSMKNKNERNVDPTSLPNRIAPTAPDLWSRLLPWHERLLADRAFTNRVRTALAVGEAEASDAVLEYLRFAYLAWTSTDGATPSKAVDEVWHAHLLFTRSYDAFCRGTRGEHLHHEPGDGGSDDGRYRVAYLLTLDRYGIEFGAADERWWPRPSATAGHPEIPPRPAGSSPLAALALSIPGVVLTAFAWAGLGSAAGLLVGGAAAVVALVALLDDGTPTARPRRRGKDSGGSCSTGDGGFVPTGIGDACTDGGGPGDGGTSCGSGCGGGGCGGA